MQYYIHHWVLEERRLWYGRETERLDVETAVDIMVDKAQHMQNTKVQEEANADMVAEYYRQADAIEVWLGRAEETDLHKKNAKLVDLVRHAGPLIKSWRGTTANQFGQKAVLIEAAQSEDEESFVTRGSVSVAHHLPERRSRRS